MMKREAKFTQLFRHWLKANPEFCQRSGAFELKQTTSGSIAFSAVKEHQIIALEAVAGNSGLLYKAPDDSRGIKPFDLFYLRQSPAYIVIKFPKHFEIITVMTFVLERDRSKKKSLTAGRAKEISVVSVKTKE